MLRWIAGNVAGWQVLLPMIVLYAMPAALLEQRRQDRWLPVAFFGAWAAGLSLGYALFDLSGMARRSPPTWAAMVLTLALITLFTLSVTQLGAGLPSARRLGHIRWSVGAAFGIVTLPITNLLSLHIGRLLLPLVRNHSQ